MRKVRKHYFYYSLSLALLAFFLLWGNGNIERTIATDPAPSRQLALLPPPVTLPVINTYLAELDCASFGASKHFPAPAKKPMPYTLAAVEKEELAKGTRDATDLYIIRSGKAGPVVMVVGGVHGNETAGYRAARIIRDYQISRGTLLVLPEANVRAVNQGVRYVSGQKDLNRCFPTSSKGVADTKLSNDIYNALKKYKVDWLMDMHEGYNYSRLGSTSSVGQSIIYYPSGQTGSTANKIINNLNAGISTSYRKFNLLRYPVQGSLSRSAGQYLGINSFILETCTRDSLNTRINYQVKAADTLLGNLGMK